MKIYLDCLPCFLRQVLEASKMATDNEQTQQKIMEDSIQVVSQFKEFRHSPEVGRAIHRIVKRHTGVSDTYKKIKQKNIQTSLKVYPLLKDYLSEYSDKLYGALKIAATGNIIDSAIYDNLDIEKCLNNELQKPFAVCETEAFRNKLKTAKNLLIIGDNAGETVFDRVLIEYLDVPEITYAVRSEPIINDATFSDAVDSGLHRCCTVMSSGCDAPGFIPEESSEEFKDIYNNADIVISKGQGNYECLSEQKREIFFLLKAKCKVLADLVGTDVHNYIFRRNYVNNS